MRRPVDPQARRRQAARAPRHRLSAPALAVVVLGTLAGCASRPVEPTPAPTLKALAARTAEAAASVPVSTSEEHTIAAYLRALQDPISPAQRAEALRRLGHLEMNATDRRAAAPEAAASTVAPPDYQGAIRRYRTYLADSPEAPGNDAVLYQLARAHDLAGEMDASLRTLDELVERYPSTAYRDEAHFRRGEMLFTKRQYAAAERAYGQVLEGAPHSAYRERAFYMRGWSQYKLNRLDDALESFLVVLDGKLPAHPDDVPLDEVAGLSRADRELVDDCMRVISIALENLQGHTTLAQHVTGEQRPRYELRLYQHLAELYLKQDRPKDAADTLEAFYQRHPQHALAPTLQTQVIEIHTRNGFDTLALVAKKDFVARYRPGSAYAQAQPAAFAKVQPQVHDLEVEFTRRYHALAQQEHRQADVDEAVQWYRTLLADFPTDPEALQYRFLLAELLYENRRWAEAITEYDTVAHAEPAHARSQESGYAALLAHNELVKAAPETERPATLRTAMAANLRFAQRFPQDARVPAVLANVADTYYKLGDGPAAVAAAEQLLTQYPQAPAPLRRVAWVVRAHTAFEAEQFAQAEAAYTEVLALTPAQDTQRPALVERVAVCVYRQGEAARKEGHLAEAARHFQRVADVAPASPVRINAQFDAASALLNLKEWAAAAKLLEDFRQRFARHALAAEVGGGLALAYTELKRWGPAAAEYERIATTSTDPAKARAAWWEVAELHEKSNNRPAAIKAWENYQKRYPTPVDAAIEARHRLRLQVAAAGDTKRDMALQRDILLADQAAGAGRTVRTRELGARAALALAAPLMDAFRQVKLVEPLAKTLKLKKERMEAALKAYTLAANYGAPEVATAATFQLATIYQDFAKSLMTSQRPKKLSALELEQYDLMLEEQADPFNEKATQLHEVNTGRAPQGVFDDWVKQSFAALRELRPGRYRKAERSEEVIDAIR